MALTEIGPSLADLVPLGFRLGAARCGLKNKRNDMGLMVSELPTRSAGVLTTNLLRAACVDYTRDVLNQGDLRAVVVNSGNANCCTGAQGVKDAQTMAKLAADALGLQPQEVAVCSTGVIGHPLDMTKVEKGILDASRALGRQPGPFMEAILTTDLVAKWAAASHGNPAVYGPGDPTPVAGSGRIFGVSKGSGMIAPNMATMLAYVMTDFDCSSFDLQACLHRAVAKSFNRVTVDGDTSTNDTLLLLSNGASGRTPSLEEFQTLLDGVCVSLAKQMARDGEGATKLVEVRVSGSSDPNKIARTIAESPLVKTAMFGCDPNWGRIVAAAGRAGVAFAPSDVRLSLKIREEAYPLFAEGAPTRFDAAQVSNALKNDHVVIDLRIGEEGEEAVVYTCDFGYGYIRINAEYHT